ncbi:F0F1 ATP synthase subunit B' [Paracoccus shanxieyensis]|uniref:ATP synthase subunit b n=1 Tax=Paracoccus shanxieyensis TaxID=2675752 RepID=A0A6L6IYC3_9RHOB|nr:F0F1 ATP synthase subunit B' [Paracoccus shanxieyensis]MTH64568.1 F0F1 ATP synthase subunit B' [Paracoccus shanxieyensis]MTH87712.1 F0F1 ATP synthase subunit B' [Paracoccus shanxieyensis]
MISLLQQTAPGVVEHSETAVQHGAEAAAHGADAAHGAAGAAGHAASAPGMPQLDFTTFGNQIFWLLVVLAVIYWVLSRVALPRIGGVISDRQGAITGDLMAAEEFKQKAKDAEAAYDKALTDARAEASKIVAANKAEIQKELDAAIAHADAEISARAVESEKRIGEIRASAVEDARSVAREVTEALVQNLGGTADQAAINAAVDQRLKGALQ